ncbi:MAG: cyclic nucleotide-binding domain-containing protein [Methyloprofundus sp.]|nr:cyclic nucleotide-binding domain-containing protein [Methyloprofundus sp.]
MTFSILDFLQDADATANIPWEIKKFTTGETIVKEGDEGQEVYFVKKGIVHVLVSMRLDQGLRKDKGIGKLSENEFFGELAVFNDNTRSATVVAATDCEVIAIQGTALLDYLDENPAKGYQILRYFFEKIAHRMRSNNIRANTIMELYLHEYTDE